jgi:hypothetical protein
MSTESIENTPVTALISGMELLAVNGHSFDNLPITMGDPLWELMRIEYKMRIAQVSAVKNAVLALQVSASNISLRVESQVADIGAASSAPPGIAPASTLLVQALDTLRQVYSASPLYISHLQLLCAKESTDGLRYINVVGGIWTSKFVKSTRGRSSSQHRVSQTTEVFTPPGITHTSSRGLNVNSPNHSPIGLGRSVKESLASIAQQIELLMHRQCPLGGDEKHEWHRALFAFQRDVQSRVTRVLGPAPDISQMSYISDGAAIALFIFVMMQKSFALQDFTLLRQDFQRTWNSIVPSLSNCVLNREISLVCSISRNVYSRNGAL